MARVYRRRPPTEVRRFQGGHRHYIGDVPQLIPGLRPMSAQQINDAADDARKVQLTVAGDGDVVPLVYGEDRIGGKILHASRYNGRLLIQVLWCLGGRVGIESIEKLYLNDQEVTLDQQAIVTHYLGTPTQGVDPIMADAVPGYADTLVAQITAGGATAPIGCAYSVIRVAPKQFSGFPRPAAIIKGMKIHDPRVSADPTDTTKYAWTDNPALIDADFAWQKTYGWGQDFVDWDSVTTAANAQDQLLGGNKRRTLDISFLARRKSETIGELLANYARVIHVMEGQHFRLINDGVTATSRSINDDDIVEGTLRLRARDISNSPTVVKVDWTDKTVTPWATKTATAYAQGVQAGTVPWRQTRISMPGIKSHEVAYRMAVERINAATLANLEGSHEVGASGLRDLPGDVIEITTKRGLTAKKVRLLTVSPSGPNTWRHSWAEYSDDMYSDEVVPAQPGNDVTLPNPLDIPQITGLEVVERPFTDQTGKTYSTIRIAWVGSDWEFVSGYRVIVVGQSVSQDSVRAHSGGGISHEFVSHHVKQGIEHTCAVSIISTLGGEGDPVEVTITPLGKLLNPTNVPRFTGFEAGQYVFLEWDQAQDEDLAGYQIRRGTVTDTWDTAIIVAKSIRANTVALPSQPVGVYRYFIKAHDSRYDLSEEEYDFTVGFSAQAATADIDITADQGGSIQTHQFYQGAGDYATYAGAAQITISGRGRWIINSENATWGADKVPWQTPGDTVNRQWLLPYQSGNSGTYNLITNEIDLGADQRLSIAAQLTDDTMFVQPTGSPDTRTHTITVATTQERIATQSRSYNTSAISTVARYIKYQTRMTPGGQDTQIAFSEPLALSLQGDPKTENGLVNITAWAWPSATVNFTVGFTTPPVVKVTYEGASPYYAVVNNVTTTNFQVYLWDSTGAFAAPLSANVRWEANE